MAIDVSKLSDKELKKLSTDLGKELNGREKGKRDAAKKAAEQAAKKHGFTLNELLGPKKSTGRKAPAPAKYKNPGDPAQTWSGRGRQPAWYKAAIKSGVDPKKLAV